MREKMIVENEHGELFGARYCACDKQVFLGGPSRFLRFMESELTRGLGTDLERKHVKTVRFDGYRVTVTVSFVEEKAWLKMKQRWEAEFFTEAVRNFRRLMY